ncbi:hypothetical protein NX722_26370 [Endozoicomonas gorgoniicola]|uniref:Uncharacterized protein n=1 Tax=Endozoicomonas gorgoniicola TaxID=1234144 RepID=A0ABT3N383_9GAMM|nr:hypothetical protein [Endozoicomonas gorgoniicola]MCW7556090.1 hypothetical protein [Endozoicomonas gorgoniicola]
MGKSALQFTQQAVAQFVCSWMIVETLFRIEFAKQAVSQFGQQLVAQLSISEAESLEPGSNTQGLEPNTQGLESNTQGVNLLPEDLQRGLGWLEYTIVQLPSIEEIEKGLGGAL